MLGVRSEDWHELNASGSAVASTLSSAGIDITVLAALLAIGLSMGQLYRWGIIWPRWTLWLSGRRVPRLLVMVPAGLVGAGLAVYGATLTVYAPLAALGVAPSVPVQAPFTTESGVTAMVLFGGLAFLGLGAALIVGLRSYGARTSPSCGTALSDG